MEIINGDLVVDDRGTVSFVNDFKFDGVKRFYMVENHEKGFVRAWHGHRKEAKYVLVTRGAIVLGVADMLKINDPIRLVLSAKKPQIVYIPPNHFNGLKTLTDDTQVIFFSTTTLEESKNDDIRKPADILEGFWDIEQR